VSNHRAGSRSSARSVPGRDQQREERFCGSCWVITRPVSLCLWPMISWASAARQARFGGGMKNVSERAVLVLSWPCGSQRGWLLLAFLSEVREEEVWSCFLCQYPAELLGWPSQGLPQIFSKPSAFATCHCLFTHTVLLGISIKNLSPNIKVNFF